MVVVLFGATGTAGTGALHACLADTRVTQIRAVTRRPLAIAHPKLREARCEDFAQLDVMAAQWDAVDCCLFCLGTSVRNVSGEAQYREIHVTYPLAAARVLLARSPAASFVYLSGAGAHRASRMMWARVKAEAEDALGALGLTRQANARPAGIVPMQPTGINRWLLAPLVRVVPPLGIGAADLGRALLHIGLERDWMGSRTYENGALRAEATR